MSSPLGPVDPSFRALPGRLDSTVRRRKFDMYALFAEGVPDTAVEIGVLHFDAYSIREVNI